MEQEHAEGFGLKALFILGLAVAILICVEIYILALFELPVWPASFALIFFFEGHLDKNNIKNILVGGSVGLVIVEGVIQLIPHIAPMFVGLFGAEAGLVSILLYVLVFLVIWIGLTEKYHIVCNNYAIGYFTIAMWNIGGFLGKAMPFELLPLIGVTVVAGAILIYGTLYAMKIFKIEG